MALVPGLYGSNVSAAAKHKNFWLPDEAGPHLRTFMQWPVNRQVHPDPVFLDMLQQSIADIANTVSEFEPVVMLMEQAHKRRAGKKLSGNIEIWDIATDDLWCRDSGPLFVIDQNRNLAVTHLNFNGWGNKQVHTNDARIARQLATRLNLPLLDNGLVGEAGGVEADGAGTLIAHESSWIIDNRNTFGKPRIEELLLQALGGNKVIWAPGVKGADITDYHIDSLVRFIVPGHLLIQLPDETNPTDPWSKAAYKTYEILKNARDANGKKFNITVIPEPYDTRIKSADFVASYVNYYVCNGAVISAQFGDIEADAEAEAILQRAYPGREIVSLNVDSIGETGGGIHCATQQQPALL